MAWTCRSRSREIIVIAIMALIYVNVANGFVPAHERPQRRNNPSPYHPIEEPETHTPPSQVVPDRDASQTELTRSESDMIPSFHSRGGIPRPRPNNPRFGPSGSRLPIFNFPTGLSAMINGVGKRVDQVEDDIDDLTGNVDDLYRELRGVVGRMTSFSRQMVRLQSQVRRNQQLQAPLRLTESDLEDRVSRLEAENRDLRRFLETFETFFQRLMSDSPEAFDLTAAPEERMSRLHQYLGNAEAELLSISQRSGTVFQSSDEPSLSLFGVADHPSDEALDRSNERNPGPTQNRTDTVENQFVMMGVQHADQQTVSTASRRGPSSGGRRTNSRQDKPTSSEVRLSAAEADRLAVAMEQLSAQNSELTSKLQMLEQKTAGSNPPGDLGSGTGAAAQGMANKITNELLDKVDRLEQVVALQASSILDSIADPGVSGESQIQTASRGQFQISSSSRRPSRPQPTTMNEEDAAIMKEMLEETRDKRSKSRKCAFSVARTTPLLGSSEPQRVSFDHVYINKGRDFDVSNSTFVCERAGFYYISFNLRSYDDHFLGVALMKNDDVVTAVYTDADSRNVMESQSVVVHLSPGDALSLRLGPSERFGIHSNIHKFVTFSGFMIYSGY